MKRRSSLRLMGWPMPPISGDVGEIMFPSLLHLAGGILDSFDDVLVPGTTAQVPGDAPANLFFRRIRILLKEGVGRHQHARRAVAALQSMLFFESCLQWMELAVLHQAFHGEQFAAIGLHCEHGAGFDGLSL